MRPARSYPGCSPVLAGLPSRLAVAFGLIAGLYLAVAWSLQP